jgi:GTP-binding protein
MIHFFEVDADALEVMLVDLPGYGWARVSRKERESWQGLIEGYLEGREVLRLAVLLQDLRRDFSEDETLLLDWLAERGIEARVVLTKGDKLKPMRRAKRAKELRAQLGNRSVPVLLTSSQARQGVHELWAAIRATV